MTARICLDPRRAGEWYRLHPTLLAIMRQVAAEWWPYDEMIVSSIWRTRGEDRRLGGTGIHATIPHRAADVAVPSWDDDKIFAVVQAVNSTWLYDPDRHGYHVAVYRPHGTGPHVHFQVHRNTRRAHE